MGNIYKSMGSSRQFGQSVSLSYIFSVATALPFCSADPAIFSLLPPHCIKKAIVDPIRKDFLRFEIFMVDYFKRISAICFPISKIYSPYFSRSAYGKNPGVLRVENTVEGLGKGLWRLPLY